MRSGTSVDIEAKVMLDEPETSHNLFFYQDEGRKHLLAIITRAEIAGIVMSSRTGGVNNLTRP
jgi:hypothetical protein